MDFGQVLQVDVSQVPEGGLLLDVREDDEWEAGHAEGALHIPMSDFVARYPELTERIDGDAPVFVICRSGGRSAQVTQYLRQQGVTAVNVDGGMGAWQSAGRPMVAENGAAYVK
ncbi:rhodanese-like domain-containing protein [Streptomyces sp. TR06-5]|uniref:rhodanese-like domain-containing protein n=1 Tax=Streptomyces sp. TR06-5 TaxID=3385976 RepID=UPI0039A00AB2